MPVEIRELQIKAVVSDTTRQQPATVEVDLTKIKKELIKECVAEVMQQLKEKTER